MKIRSILFIGAAVLAVSAYAASEAFTPDTAAGKAAIVRDVVVPPAEQAATIEAMKPPKRRRPVVAVLALNQGAETTDFLVPYSVLSRSRVADVLAVAPDSAPVTLRPALTIRPQATLAAFDARYPEGADYVIVPAMYREDDPVIVAWIRAQAKKGSIIVGICAGGLTLAEAGLLHGRDATGYWGTLHELRKASPTMRWVRDRRYVADKGVVTTTGVTASLPVSLAIVEAIAGRAHAETVAREIGVNEWQAGHDTEAFYVDGPNAWMAARTGSIVPSRDDFGVLVDDGVDEISLAFTADAYSRVRRSRALTVADKVLVRTRNGLELLVDRSAEAAHVDNLLPSVPTARPAHALDAALSDINRRYGPELARKIAHQLEYPRRSFSR